MYGSSSLIGDGASDISLGDTNRDSAFKKGLVDSMPFPLVLGEDVGLERLALQVMKSLQQRKPLMRAMWETGCFATWAGKKAWD